MRAYRGTLTEPGKDSPYRDPIGGREPRSLPPDARRRVPRRRPCAARQDRHGVAEHQPARPGALPDPPRRASPDRQRAGASTRCTTSRIRCRTRSKASPTRSARSSTRITGRSTTGRSSMRRPTHRPRQYEFARLNLNYTVMSKRKLLQLVAQTARVAAGTTRGCRRSPGCGGAAIPPNRSATSARASALRRRRTSSTSALLEHCVREDLNRRAPRAMAVLRSAQARVDQLSRTARPSTMNVVNNPEDPSAGTRKVPFSARALHRARRLHGGPAEEVLPARARARSAAAQRLPRHLHERREERRRRDSSSCTAPTIPPRAAAMRPTAAR